ncbi:MAG: glucose 1-dehydrogenase [Planctomycetes bacterium]|nr:glucose 1-dehydrogenase [Planctomycetota bacterium]
MKAIAVRPSSREVGSIEVPMPRRRGEGDVLLRMLEVGVCGTDREICSFEYGTPPQNCDHLILGHESVAEVVEAGPMACGFEPGDLVVPSVRRTCPHASCRACREGRQDFCFTGEFTERGIKNEHGFMTEYVVEQCGNLHRVPAELRDVAVLVEPLTIAQKALSQLKLIQTRLPWQCPAVPGHLADGSCRRALVLGAGPVGLLGAMTLAHAGFETWVYSRERTPNPRAALVDSIGARYLSAEEVPVDQLPDRLGSIDVVYEAIGASELAFRAAGVLGTNGVFILTGVPGRRGPASIDTDRLMRNMVLKNQVVLGTVNAAFQTFEDAIADLTAFRRRWPQAVQGLITGRFPMEAHRDLLLGRTGGIKNVLSIAA